MADAEKCPYCGHINDQAEYDRRRNQMTMTMTRWEELALAEARLEGLAKAAGAVVELVPMPPVSSPAGGFHAAIRNLRDAL